MSNKTINNKNKVIGLPIPPIGTEVKREKHNKKELELFPAPPIGKQFNKLTKRNKNNLPSIPLEHLRKAEELYTNKYSK